MTGELSIEPLIGWRVWSLVMRRAGRVPSLQPAGAGRGEWSTRRPYRAMCRRLGLPGPELAQHPSPVPGCTCGIYASSSLRNLVTSTPSMPVVSAVGTVALWGRVIEHERGWRAEFAYPDRLTLVCVICLQEGSGAGEPAFVVAEPVASGPYPAVAVCRDHAASVTAEGSRVISPAAVIRSALLDRYAVDLMPFDTVRSLFERDPVPVPFTRPSSPTPVPARQVPARVAPAGSAAPPAAPPAATPAPTPVRREPLRPTRPGPPSIGRRIARGIGQVVTFVLQAAFFLLMAAWGLAARSRSASASIRPAWNHLRAAGDGAASLMRAILAWISSRGRPPGAGGCGCGGASSPPICAR